MSRTFGPLILVATLLAPSAAFAQGADVVVTCMNPKQNIHVKTEPLNESGDGWKASFTVQFNIGPESKGGAIFVNGNNDGICRAEVRNGKHIAGDPQWSMASEYPAGTFSKINVTASKENDVAEYKVSPGAAEKSTVTLKFIVEYK